MREGVEVDTLGGHGRGVCARVRADDDRIGQERCRCGAGGELGRELAEHEVLGLGLDQSERRRVPEEGGAAVAEHHFPVVGQPEQGGDAVAEAADHVFHRRLAVGGAEIVRRSRSERGDGLGSDLGRSGAESAISGEKIRGNRN